MADGGEGTVQSLVDATGGKIINTKVTGPLGGEKVNSEFGLLGKGNIAVIEMAKASGLTLISEDKLNPCKTTTYGTGELIKAALDKDVEEIVIGIGGSATNDAGVGMAQALGVKFKDINGKEIGLGGENLVNIHSIDVSDLDPRVKDIKIEVACDVSNPLYGPEGAAYIYGPQKGADKEMVEFLDVCLRHYAGVIKKELARDIQTIIGAGAAGGLGAGLVTFLDAELMSGIGIVLEVNRINDKLKDVNLVITGEGRIDGQTINGKTAIGVAKKAKEFGIPVIAIGAILGNGVEKVLTEGVDGVFNILQHVIPIEEEPTEEWLQFSIEQILRIAKLNIFN